METIQAEQILKHFSGRMGVLAVQPLGKSPAPRELELEVDTYLSNHVKEQKECYGIYLVDENNQVKCTCVDFDNHDNDPNPKWKEEAYATYNHLKKMGLDPVFEISSSGSGAHVWLFFSEPIDAGKAIFFWKSVDSKLKIGYKEIYPRQAKLREGGLGNQVRLPYWNKSKIIDPNAGPDDIGFDEVDTITPVELEEYIQAYGYKEKEVPVFEGSDELPERVAELVATTNSSVAQRWNGILPEGFNDTTNSSKAYALARDLVYERIPTDEIEQSLRVWCNLNSYDKPDTWIKTTVANAYKGVSDNVAKKLAIEEDPEGNTLFSCINKFVNRIGYDNYFGSGIKPLDDSIDGVGPGEMAIIAARPGHGKSAIALQWLMHAARNGTPVLMLNAEMGRIEIGRRAIQTLIGGDESEWQNRQKEIEYKATELIEKLPFYFHNVSTLEHVEKYMAHYAKKGVQLIAVDYLQLLRAGKKQGRYEAVTEISQRIKTSAREHNVGVLALCQVSRDVERRDNVHFNASDLRESGQLEQDADLIMFGWWHARGAYNRDPKKYDLHIAKRRNGPIRTAKVELSFDAPRQQFRW